MVTLILIGLYCFNNGSLPLLRDNDAMGMILTFIGTGMAIDTVLLACIKNIISFLKNPKEYREKKTARKELKRLIKSELSVKYSPIIGGAWGEFANIYNLHLKKYIIASENDDKIKTKLNLDGSYLLYGKAGSGKSTYLRKLFYSRNKNKLYLCLNILLSRIVIYFNAKELFDGKHAEQIIALIKSAKYRRVYLICDGLDELGEQEDTIESTIKTIYEFHQAQYNGKMNIIIGGRDSCIRKYQHSLKFAKLFSKQYFLKDWSAEDIESLVREIKRIISNKNYTIDNIFTNNTDFAELASYNPMRCKMLCIIAAQNDRSLKHIAQNQYSLYLEFLERLFEHEYQRKNITFEYEKKIQCALKRLAQFAFERYQLTLNRTTFFTTNENIIDTWEEDYKSLALLIWDNQRSQFLHHTYEEFLVAYYYMFVIDNCTFNNIKDSVEILSYLHNNNYSDFISDGFSCRRGHEELLINKLIYIYCYTLPKHLQKQLCTLKEYGIFNIFPKGDMLRANQQYIKALSKKQYIYLKYEITFRVGRFKTVYALSFLRFVYYKDTIALYKKFTLTPYELVILKRQCAISASFLCGTDVELDYVCRMLPEKETYEENYDLVNRSHTLIYYGDVVHTDLLSFLDNGESKWDYARFKRINRLRKKPKEYSLKDKVTCFRLFDLATIYTFLYSRRQSFTLSESEEKIIRDTVVTGISNMPREREQLMIWLKNQILDLQNLSEE